MTRRNTVTLLLMSMLVISSTVCLSQFDPGELPVKIFGILDTAGTHLGMVVVTSQEGRGYKAGYESWRFKEAALLEIAEQESLTLEVWATGDWNDPWVVEALRWQPEESTVEWSHPATVEWTPQDEELPPLPAAGTYFGNATLGGLRIHYSSHSPSALTWFKLTEGAYMQLDEGAVFERDPDVPQTGSWWHGAIELGT